ncbi:hypothetical protein B4109_3089 [Geobacillus stearothermophilus]|uniref:Uncharacterized protein n=1 Tax=Geobacillus stearothermophilus TaxID=1422 RepID=A0A150MTW2_GEOSE|nr:hypothetical protein B4109_3089 [Geobacillus stearothermophilus]
MVDDRQPQIAKRAGEAVGDLHPVALFHVAPSFPFHGPRDVPTACSLSLPTA